ncbi:MAG: hypothetical protein WKF97_09740 [Chitinophagaceae bacterium]
MKTLTYSAYLLISLVFFISCKKEYSSETGTLPVIDTLRNNCKLKELIEKDAVSGRAEYAYISTYNSSNVVSRIVLFDSINNVTDNSFPVSYPANRVQIDANQYFLTAADGKVTEFHGYEYPNDPSSSKITAKYSYNALNQLSQRTEENDSFPGRVTFHMDYTYTNNNLTKAVASVFNGIGFQVVAEITYEYDASKTVKNFLFLHALAPDIIYFQTAIKAGLNSVNAIRKATLKFTDPLTGIQITRTSNFTNFIIDAKNFVKSFDLTGDDFDVAGLYAGQRYVLNYFCF